MQHDSFGNYKEVERAVKESFLKFSFIHFQLNHILEKFNGVDDIPKFLQASTLLKVRHRGRIALDEIVFVSY